MIDNNWRPKKWIHGEPGDLGELAARWLLTQINEGDVPPGIEDIAAVVARVKARHKLVELAEDQSWPIERCPNHSIKKPSVRGCLGCEKEIDQAEYAFKAAMKNFKKVIRAEVDAK